MFDVIMTAPLMRMPGYRPDLLPVVRVYAIVSILERGRMGRWIESKYGIGLLRPVDRATVKMALPMTDPGDTLGCQKPGFRFL